jgi:hypothetical protein
VSFGALYKSLYNHYIRVWCCMRNRECVSFYMRVFIWEFLYKSLVLYEKS